MIEIFKIGEIMNCRACDQECNEVIDFGLMPIANNFVEKKEDDKYRFSLKACFCQGCALFQLSEQPDPNLMFHEHYPFFTGLSLRMKTHFSEMIERHLNQIPKATEKLFVVEIGSNDGTLLSFVKKKNVRHLGIDPSSNVVKSSWNQGISAEIGFFSEAFAKDVSKRHGKADLIIAANVVCHIANINDFAKGIKELLARGGQFIFEEPYIGNMIEQTSYDQIYDEHVFIFGALSVQKIFSKAGLELVTALPQNTHGGSMRYVLMHSDEAQSDNRLEKILKYELEMGLDKLAVYKDFAKRCNERKAEFKNLLQKLNAEGATVAGYAATSKSTTVLNYCNIDSTLIQFISDSTPEKIGRFTPGSYIPIISHEVMRDNPPDYLVLFAWNHEKEIFAKELDLGQNKIRWVRIVPRIEVI
jgi:methylation protein EvaC